ncbi:MAG: WG repeat-containing protein [Bacteroidales bacterium]|nr:WG repeat-containing protein [Bacteroidales bacterium]
MKLNFNFHLSSSIFIQVLIAVLLLPLSLSAQEKEKVVIVDDESCGCELYFIDGIQTIRRDGLFGFKREDGTIIAEAIYKFVDKFHGDYCIVFNDYDQCGIIDRNGRIIVPVQYPEVNYPTDGMIRFRKDDKYGFYDTAGNIVIEPQYRTVSGFNQGLAAVIIDFDSDNCAYGYINKQNQIEIQPIYQYAYPFNENCAIVKNYDRYGIIDRHGNELLPIKYAEITTMLNDHFFAVDATIEKAALFNNRFKPITKFIYDKIQSYNDGYYVVERNGKSTYLDFKGKERFGFYDYAAPFSDGYAMVSRNGKYGIINERGKFILPLDYDNSGYRSMEYVFSENLAMIEKDGKYGFINKSGKIVIPLIYQSAQHCTEGIIPVKLHGQWGFIDKNGRQLTDFVFDAASYFEWGRAEVLYNGTTYKINTDGVCVKNCKTYPKELQFKNIEN